MPAKVDIFIGLQARDRFSLGQNRARLGYRAFHWSIIVFDGQYHRFDITDGIVQDPVTFQDVNPDRCWVYRHNVSSSLQGIPRYLGSVQLNKKSIETTTEKIATICGRVPIPHKDADRTFNNCVSWTMEAVECLQKANFCPILNLKELQDSAIAHADKRLADYKNTDDPIKHPPSTNRWLRLF